MLLVVGILVGMVGYGQPTIQWEVCLGGSGDDEAQSIYQTTDGGYIIAGFSNSHDGQVTNSHGGAWVTKLNANGILQWQKNYGGSSYYDMVYSIIQTTDGS